MAIKKEIIVTANTDQAEAEMKSLAKSIDKVGDEAVKTKTSIKDVGDNGGAIAVLDSLTGGLATKMRDVGEATKLFNFSLKGTRTALIATGIGAFVVALGLVVAYWEEIEELIIGANKELKKQLGLIYDVQDSLSDDLDFNKLILDSLELQGKSIDETLIKRKGIIKELQIQLIQANTNLSIEAEGLKNLDGQIRRRKILNALIAGLTGFKPTDSDVEENEKSLARLKEIGDQINANQKKIVSLNNEIIGIDNILNTEPEEDPKDPKKDPKEDKLSPEEQLLKDLETETLLGLEATQRAEEREKLRLKSIEEIRRNAFEENALAALNREETAVLAELTALQGSEEDKLLVIEAFAKKRAELLDDEAENEAKTAKILQKQREDQNDVRLATADSLASSLGKLGEKSKALAVASIIIDQVSGAARAIQSNVVANAAAVAAFPLTFGQPFVAVNTISTIAGIAAGALSAKKAISEIGGSGSVGNVGGLPQAGGGGQSAPAFNLVEGTESNQIAEGLNRQNNPVQAFVVSSSVTTSQELDRNIESSSSIG